MLQTFTQRRGLGALLVGLLALGIVAILFPGVLRHPGHYMQPDGDGIKNYFVVAYYAQYDHGQLFTGMNYPRGEHINYPDMQPLLALVVAAMVLYRILRRLALPGWYAGIIALCITFLAPQVLRFQAHMSLSYACVVPIQWYCVLRIMEAPRRARWYLALGIFNILVGLLATYYLGIGSLWLLAYVPVLLWQQGWRKSAPVVLRLVATALGAMLVFAAWLKLTDPITDRPANPWGLFFARSHFTGLFSPSDDPGRTLWHYFFPTTDVSFEAIAYVGAVGVLVLVLTGVLVLRYLRRGQWRRVAQPVLPTALRTGLWAATVLLVFATAFPFFLPGLHDFVWLLGPLKQFRALGRFAWPFYFVFATYAAYYVYLVWRYLRQHRAPAFATSWLAPLLVLWGLEAYAHTKQVATAIEARQVGPNFTGEENNFRDVFGWTNKRPEDFQAILPLPYYAIGTDKISMESTGETRFQSFKAALNLHLPLLAMFMARSSVSESLHLTQLLSSPLIEKELLSRLPSTKPILLVVVPNQLNENEKRIVALAHLIRATPEVAFYELPVAALASTTLAAERSKAAALLPTLTPHNGLYTSTGKGALYVSFDQSPDRHGRLAAGCFAEPRETFSTLYDGPLPMPADTGRYEASVWVDATTAYSLGNFQAKIYGHGNQLEHVVADTHVSTEIQGNWVRVAVIFHRPADADRLELIYDNQDLRADDVLVRPLDTDVYWLDQRGQPVLNGYPLGK
jgi:hypothetical protein